MAELLSSRLDRVEKKLDELIANNKFIIRMMTDGCIGPVIIREAEPMPANEDYTTPPSEDVWATGAYRANDPKLHGGH